MSTWQRCKAHLILQTQMEIYINWILGTKAITKFDVIKLFPPQAGLWNTAGKVLLPHRPLRNIVLSWVSVTTGASNIAFFLLWINLLFGLKFFIQSGWTWKGIFEWNVSPVINQRYGKSILKFPCKLGLHEIPSTYYEPVRLYWAISPHLHLSRLLPTCDPPSFHT